MKKRVWILSGLGILIGLVVVMPRVLRNLSTVSLPVYWADMNAIIGQEQSAYIGRLESDGEDYTDFVIPPDPWGGPYVVVASEGLTVVVLSYGADLAPGGVGDAADRCMMAVDGNSLHLISGGY